MKIIGCGFHTRYQQILMLDEETGELVERGLIPAGTGLERYRNIELLTEVPPPPPPEEVMPPAELSAEEAAALDFLRKDADALAEGGSD